jgi:hypothetical protein
MKRRKKASSIIEFIVVFPIFMILIWGIVQVMLYLNAIGDIGNAAKEVARAVSMEARGLEGPMRSYDLNPVKQANEEIALKMIRDRVQEVALQKISSNTYMNKLIKIGAPNVFVEDKAACNNAIKVNLPQFVCIDTEKVFDGATRSQEQIVVRIKGTFKVIGSLIPIQDLPLSATGLSHKELTDRFQYYSKPVQCFNTPGPTC